MVKKLIRLQIGQPRQQRDSHDPDRIALAAPPYRQAMRQRFQAGREISGTDPAA
jgi:hypothetical protein